MSVTDQKKTKKGKSKKKWAPMFYPKDHWKELEAHDLNSNRIMKPELRASAKEVIYKRKLFLAQADHYLQR